MIYKLVSAKTAIVCHIRLTVSVVNVEQER